MINSKQRAYLRSLATGMDTIFQIGKAGITEETCHQLANALEARELIKLSVLENCMETPKETANELAEATDADVVGVVGRKIILYRQSVNNKRIEL